MKVVLRSLLTFACLLGLATAATAQTAQTAPAPRGRVQPKPRVVANPAANNVKDGLTLKSGRVILTELGIITPLTTDKKLVNGTVITPTGLVTSPGGTATQMGEGDMVSLTGRITSHSTIVVADSLLKIKQFDLKFPGKREKMAKEKAEKDKVKKERDDAKAKIAAERAKEKAKAAKKR